MRSGRDYVPDRGDLVWLDFNPQAGHEQRGRRPALILSPKAYNEKTSLCIALPITSKVKGYPFEVKLDPALPIHGVILADQVKSLDFTVRNATLICRIDEATLHEVQRKLSVLIH